MPEVAETPVEQKTEELDRAAFIKARNEGKPFRPAEPEKPAEPAAKPAKSAPVDDDEDEEPAHDGKPASRMPRSARRLREQLAHERGAREMLERLIAQGLTPKQAATVVADAEPDPAAKPQRAKFTNDAEYFEALSTWTAANAKTQATEAVKEAKSNDEFMAQVRANTAKHDEDAATFEDWDEVKEVADQIVVPTKAKMDFVQGFMARCKERARVEYWLGKHPDEANSMMEMELGDLAERLIELAVEVKYLYPKNEPAAQAPQNANGKDRTPPEKPVQGGTAAERDLRKPKPTSEVSARGGSAPPDDPDPVKNPAAWIARRNATRNGR